MRSVFLLAACSPAGRSVGCYFELEDHVLCNGRLACVRLRREDTFSVIQGKGFIQCCCCSYDDVIDLMFMLCQG